MERKILQLTKELQQSTGGHIFYYFNDLDRYIENTVSYIRSGIDQKDRVIVIENERVYSLIYKKLVLHLTEDELTKVHYVNNFDFYCLNGDFHASTILSYFSLILEPYIIEITPIRTWAHVEWGNVAEITEVIGEFEKQANRAVSSMGLISVCAYNADRVPASLKASLKRSHGFLMTDDDIIPLLNEQE
ncbi:MEDS domain-containing protein [Bacillus sp. UMB0893]|uniref:MEDS domain-containing protein n=1 Tax=Bacillus sp. UMB0893 TaxID=2066053 RepID=UPI000C76D97C|nr:MEDS domain-containing protein [Bacillus sp. UMB0893]PLR69219.1 3-ketoacyl-ACP reductase [Bacillus sp. UMB0893]